MKYVQYKISIIFVLVVLNLQAQNVAQNDGENINEFNNDKTNVSQLQDLQGQNKESDDSQILSKDPNELFVVKQSFINGEGGIDGLKGSVNVRISQDGNEVYVLGQQESSFAVFRLDTGTGTYIFEKVYDEKSSRTALSGIWDIVTSMEGEDLYLSAFDSDAIIHYRRLDKGDFVYKWSYINNQNSISGLNGPRDMVLSSDGLYLYVANEIDSSIVIFDRNTSTGDLIFNSVIRGSKNNVAGFKGIRGIAMTRDGTKLYAAAYTGNALISFDRDKNTGVLRFRSMLKNGQDGILGLEGASSIVVDDKGRIFLSAFKSNAISVYAEEPELTQLDIVSNGQRDVKFLTQPNRIATNRAGDTVFVTSYGDNSLSEFSYKEEAEIFKLNSTDTEDQDIATQKTVKSRLKQLSVFREGVGGVRGLEGAWGIAVNPNGDVLVSGFKSNALSLFRVDGTQGERYAYIESYFDNTGMVEGLFRSFDVIRSHDDKNLYVSGVFSNSLGIFTRDSEGRWRFQDSITEGVEATKVSQSNEIIQNNASKLIGLWNLIESKDGRNIYATRYVDDALVSFSRDTSTGALTYMNTIYDETNEVDGLSGAYDLVLSEDDSTLYVSGFKDDAIAIFNRNTSDGSLSFLRVIREGLDKLSVTDGTYSLAISPDDKNLYATNLIEDSVIIFSRESNGDLSFLTRLKNTKDVPRGLEGAYSIVVHPNGSRVYVAGENSDTLVVFDRNEDGSLKLKALIENDTIDGSINEMDGPKNIYIDASSNFLYLTENKRLLVFELDEDLIPRLLTRIDNYSFKELVSGFDEAWSVSSSSDGKEIYVTGYSENTLSILGLKE